VEKANSDVVISFDPTINLSKKCTKTQKKKDGGMRNGHSVISLPSRGTRIISAFPEKMGIKGDNTCILFILNQ